jgi:hypothetical protein
MGLFSDKAKFLFKTGKLPDLTKYHGMKVHIPGVEEPVIIKRIVGNVWKPQFYEINDKYLIGMLRFHAQMVRDKSITEEQFLAFEEMDMSAEKLPEAEQGFEADARRLADRIMKDASKQTH